MGLAGPGRRSFNPPGVLGAQRKPNHAVAEHEPRGAAGRLGSVKAAARGRERALSRIFYPQGALGAQRKPDHAVAEHEPRCAISAPASAYMPVFFYTYIHIQTVILACIFTLICTYNKVYDMAHMQYEQLISHTD